MGKGRSRGGSPFWRAGEDPVRPVSTFRKTDETERGNKEVRKEATKEKQKDEQRVVNMPKERRRNYSDEEREKAKKAAGSEKWRAYQRAVEEEKEMEKDSGRRAKPKHRGKQWQQRGNSRE